MTTTYNLTKNDKTGAAPSYQEFGFIGQFRNTIDLSDKMFATLVSGDILQLFTIPAGHVLRKAYVGTLTAMGAAGTFAMGDSSGGEIFAAGAVLNGTAGTTLMGNGTHFAITGNAQTADSLEAAYTAAATVSMVLGGTLANSGKFTICVETIRVHP